MLLSARDPPVSLRLYVRDYTSLLLVFLVLLVFVKNMNMPLIYLLSLLLHTEKLIRLLVFI